MASNKVRIFIKLTPDEKQEIYERMKDSGYKNLSAYMRKMALNGYIINLNRSRSKNLHNGVGGSAYNTCTLAKPRCPCGRGGYLSDNIGGLNKIRKKRDGYISRFAKAFIPTSLYGVIEHTSLRFDMVGAQNSR